MMIDFPEIITGTRASEDNVIVNVGNNQFNASAIYVDSTFLEIFSFPIIDGKKPQPFDNISSIVITRETSQRLFGTDHSIGKELQVDFENVYRVSAIIDNVPKNSTIQFDMLMLITSHPQYAQVEKSWGGSFLNTYIVLNEKSHVSDLTKKFPQFIEKIWDEETRARTNFKLLPLLESYDTFVGDSSDAYILIYIALGILLIASINFMNLATATSVDRAKEIGIRKVMGSNQIQLAARFMGESILTTYLALLIGVLLASIIIPWINNLFEMEMILNLTNPSTMLALVGFATLLGFISGLYPAIFISNFSILMSLKGNVSSGGGTMRKSLVIIQFALSSSLVILSLIVWKQLDYVVHANLSFNKENVIIIPVSSRNFEDRDDASIRIQSYRDEIGTHSNILSSATSTHVPSQWSGSNVFVRAKGWEGDPLRMRYTYHDASFFETYGIELLDGPGFLPDSEGNQRGSVVLNQAAANAFGFSDSREKAIKIGSNEINVVGIIKDFNFETLRDEITPILHFHRIPSNGVHQYISIRVNPERVNESLDFLEEKWTMISESTPFEYFFLDESLKKMYATEDRMLKMVGTFSIVTIFIACLGLFGLSSFMIEKRKKEMGIRKVLGASSLQVFYSAAANFTLFIFIGFVFAIPLAYYLSSQWLNGFAYVASIGVGVYIVALTGTLTIGLLTVSYKSFRAATNNPVDTLRDE